jgi:hypothetical protein
VSHHSASRRKPIANTRPARSWQWLLRGLRCAACGRGGLDGSAHVARWVAEHSGRAREHLLCDSCCTEAAHDETACAAIALRCALSICRRSDHGV